MTHTNSPPHRLQIDKAFQILVSAHAGVIFATIPFSDPAYHNIKSVVAIILICFLLLALLVVGFITSADSTLETNFTKKTLKAVIAVYIFSFSFPAYCFFKPGLIPLQMIYQSYSMLALVIFWLFLSTND